MCVNECKEVINLIEESKYIGDLKLYQEDPNIRLDC